MSDLLTISARKADGAGAGHSGLFSGQPRVRLTVPDDLRREIEQTKAAIQTQKPATLIDAEPCLVSICLQWEEQIKKGMDDALAPLKGNPFAPVNATCLPMQVLDFFVRDFPTREEATPARISMLFSIFDHALRGQVNLWESESAEPPAYPPRRWTRRWWKNLFRAALDSLPGRASTPGPGRVFTLARPVPVSPAAPLNVEPGSGHADMIENPS